MNQEEKKIEELLSDPSMKNIWDLSANYTYEEAAQNDQAWNKLHQAIQEKQHSNKPTLKVSYSRLLAYAAALGLVILSVGVYFGFDKYNSEHPLSAKIENLGNEVKQVSLPDGSVISLNGHSALEYQFTSEARALNLSGQAHFEVAPNKEAPFKVTTTKGSVTVLGTGFDVLAYPNQEMSVSVSHGKVKVEAQKQSVVLTKGMSAATFKNQLNKVELDSNCVIWKGENLEFNNTPISIVFSTIENTYGVSMLHYGSEQKASKEELRFTGKFKHNQRIEDIEAVLEMAFKMKIETVRK